MLLPSIGVSGTELVLGPPGPASELGRSREYAVALAVLPLLDGRLLIESLALSGGRVFLERLPAGDSKTPGGPAPLLLPEIRDFSLSDFEIVTADTILSFINDITRAFRAVMVSIPLLSIVIGGIVIMNIMMISVTERTREIGIRKSIGARRRNILQQFLYESLILSLIGGGTGIITGVWVGEWMLSSLMDIYVAPTGMAIIMGAGIAIGVGLFFGIYPAMKAARYDPIKALSYE